MLLKIDGINVYYDAIYAIKNVSLEINEGEIVTLIGANGAGKSTILKTISGLLRSKTGSIKFMNKEISNMLPHKIVKCGLAHIPEGRRLFMQMTVHENLKLGSYVRDDNVDSKLMEVYNYFPRLLEREKQIAGTLSGGEQQMLAIGRALMSNPKLLMMDEPSMGLAPKMVEQIFAIIKTLNEKGSTILLVEQNANMALSIANRAYVLETGSITLAGNSNYLSQSDKIRKAYLGA